MTDSHDRNKPGLRRFLLNVLLFSLLTAAGLAACELYVRTRINSISYQHAYVREHGNGISTLILGASSIWWGVDPKYFPSDSVFSMAYNGQSLHHSRRIMETCRSRMPALREIVLGILPCSFTDYPTEVTDSWMSEIPFTIYTDFNDHSPFSRYNFEICFPPRFRQILLPWLDGTHDKFDRLGHSTQSPAANRDKNWRKGFRWISGGHVAPDFRYVGYNIAEMRGLLDFCRREGIRVTVVQTPLYPAYTLGIPRRQMALHYSAIRGLQAEYGFRFLDFADDPRVGPEAFYDVVHLSTDTGSRIFTPLLVSDLGKADAGSQQFPVASR